MLLPQILLILPRVATRGGAVIAGVLGSKTSRPIRSAYPVGLTEVTPHASALAVRGESHQKSLASREGVNVECGSWRWANAGASKLRCGLRPLTFRRRLGTRSTPS